MRDLTPYQLQILRLLADGLTYRQMAKRLYLRNENSLRSSVRKVHAKLGAANSAQAVHIGHLRGLLNAPHERTGVAAR